MEQTNSEMGICACESITAHTLKNVSPYITTYFKAWLLNRTEHYPKRNSACDSGVVCLQNWCVLEHLRPLNNRIRNYWEFIQPVRAKPWWKPCFEDFQASTSLSLSSSRSGPPTADSNRMPGENRSAGLVDTEKACQEAPPDNRSPFFHLYILQNRIPKFLTIRWKLSRFLHLKGRWQGIWLISV